MRPVKITSSQIVLLSLIILFQLDLPSLGDTSICGEIDETNNHWTIVGSPYVICGSGAWTAEGITLTIDSGVEVRGGDLTGAINANGANFSNEIIIESGSLTSCNIHNSFNGLILSGPGIMVYNCTIEYCTFGVRVKSLGTNAAITNCFIRNCDSIGLRLEPGVFPDLSGTTLSGSIYADVWIMSGNYSGNLKLISSGDPMKVGLQWDVNHSGGTIILQGPLEILGYSGSSSFLGELILGADSTLEAEGVTFRGMDGGGWQGLQTTAEDASISVTDCTFQNANCALNVIEGSVMASHCTFNDLIYISPNGSANITDCTFEYSQRAIKCSSSNVTIDNCIIRNCTQHAIRIYGCDSSAKITNCCIYNNSAYGLQLQSGAFPDLSGTTFWGHEYDVYILYGNYTRNLELISFSTTTKVLLMGDINHSEGTITLKGPIQIYVIDVYPYLGQLILGAGSSFEAEGVTFQGYDGGGWGGLQAVAEDTSISLKNCVVKSAGVNIINGKANFLLTQFFTSTAINVQNTTGCNAHLCYFNICTWGVHNTSASIVDARLCWWGHESGPGPVGPGTGCQVSTNVLYEPWLGTGINELDNIAHHLGRDENAGSDKDPVNTAIGNFTHSETDLLITARGLPLSFTRFYNSRDDYIGPLGKGWTHTYNSRLDYDNNIITIKWHDGRVDKYADVGDGNYLPFYQDLYDSITHNPDGSWQVTKKDLSVYSFDETGRLITVSDKNNNTIALSYTEISDPNLVTGITDPVGRQLILSYTNGLLTQITDPNERTLEFVYTAGKLTEVKDILNNVITELLQN